MLRSCSLYRVYSRIESLNNTLKCSAPMQKLAYADFPLVIYFERVYFKLGTAFIRIPSEQNSIFRGFMFAVATYIDKVWY